MSGAFEPWIWPYERLDEALRALVRRCGLGDAQAPLAFTPPALAQTDVDALSRWIERLADWLGVEAEPLEASYPELEQLVRGAAPALLQVSSERGVGFAVVVRGGRSLSLLTPELELVKVPAQQVRATLCRTLEQPALARADALLDASGVAPERRAVARGALVRQWLSTVSIAGCWLVRPLPGAPLATLLRHARAGRRLAVALAGYAAQSALGLAGWWLMGRGAFEGKLEHAWLLAWVLVQLSTVPLSLCSSWAWGQLSIDLGALFRQRLLAGALALDLEQLRHQGAGQLLGRVLDARAVEQQVLTGGFGALVSALDLLAAGLVLAAGAAATGQLLLLAAWLLLALAIGGAYLARWRSWTLLRIELSNDLIEAMVGHRTRLAQERRERWHEGEDGALERYLAHSLALDQSALWAGAALSRGFLLFGLTALAPAFIAGDATPARGFPPGWRR